METIRTVAVCKGNGISRVNQVVCRGYIDKRKSSGELIRESCDGSARDAVKGDPKKGTRDQPAVPAHEHKIIGTTSKGLNILSEYVETIDKPEPCGRTFDNPHGTKCSYCGGDLEFYDYNLAKKRE